ncbi:MAG: hypothetical protein IKF68_03895 [Erysipelotrichaceae bacterium]|nr:hypothetical protein [Erysipelotrichaceae bacterium]
MDIDKMKGIQLKEDKKIFYIEINNYITKPKVWFYFSDDGVYYSSSYGNEVFDQKEDITGLLDNINSILNDQIVAAVSIQLKNAGLRFDFQPRSHDREANLNIFIRKRKSHQPDCDITIDRKQMEYFRFYLMMVIGMKPYRDKSYMDDLRKKEIIPSFRWCLVGNIINEHFQGENKDIVHGTKHFSPNTKVYIAPANWGDGFEKVIVIGKQRKRFKYIELVMPSKWTENWRLGKICKPEILNIIEISDHTWWDDSITDKEHILELANNHKDTVYRLKDILTKKELDFFIRNNLPTECKRDIDSLWKLISELTKLEPLTEEIETITDKLQDNL